MWIPKSEADIRAAVSTGSLEESAIFDAKRELPSKNIDIAKDIAAMANDGGVIIYGIGEDEHKRPTILNPIPLAGQRERIAAIIQSSVAEPPTIQIQAIETDSDPSRGYIVVIVPPSERAPHMVIAQGDNRYYGRSATGNIVLGEADVARLYERRRRWDIDRDAILNQEIANSPFPTNKDAAYLFAFARPVVQRDEFFQRQSSSSQSLSRVLNDLIDEISSEAIYPFAYEPNFHRPNQWARRVEGYLGKLLEPSDPTDATASLHLQIDFNGTGHLFCGRAAENEQATFFFFPTIVAGNTTKFLAMIGKLYHGEGYLGLVDVGISVVGLKGSVIYPNISDRYGYDDLHFRLSSRVPYDRHEYRKTARVSASQLHGDPIGIAKQLIMPLVDAMSQGRFDPFPTDTA